MGKIYLNNYKKEQFKNVYFIAGTATGGKTTISKALAEKYGWLRYDVDERFDKHQKLSNPIDQPNMNKSFKNADEFFLRDVDEYVQWLKDNSAEQMEFILEDLVKLSQNQIVVCDLHLTVEEAKTIAEPNQVVFLIRENNDNIIDDYCHRPSHVGFNSFINSASNPALAKQNCNEVLRVINEERCDAIRNSNFFYIERNEKSTVKNTLKQVEDHFGLKSSLELLTIQKVDKDSIMVEKLANFVQNFSWLDVKEHMLKMINNWEFSEWETPFVATIGDKIIGMATIMKSDYYPLPATYPWVSCIFVDEQYRGNRISGKLIDFANDYAKQLGFKRTYIPTEFVGLYEKYGYHYLKDIVNYGNGVDRLYVKEL